MGDETPAEPETPWAVAKRMRAEGHLRGVIVERLKAMGLDDGDVRVLLFEDLPPPPEDDVESALLTAGVMVVAGPLVGSLVAAALSEAGQAPAPAAPQVPLSPTDPSRRCAWHPTLASVASCPRCGAFTCLTCAPRADERVCENCARHPRGATSASPGPSAGSRSGSSA